MKISLIRQSWARRKPALAMLALALAASTAMAQDRPRNSAGGAASGNTAEAHLGAGYENLRNNRYDAAAREFQAALALDPALVLQARFPLAVALFELHRLDESRGEFQAVEKAAGSHPNVEYYLGRIDLQQGKLDAAVHELTQAAIKPPFPDTAYYLGYAYLKRHDLAAAEKWLKRAAEINPRDAEVEYRLGALYSEAGRKDEAQRAFSRSEELRRREAEVDRQRVDCTEKLAHGPLRDARPVCAKLFDPEDADKLTILGTLYGQHGDFEEALAPLRRAAELSPNSPQMQYNLAFDYFQLGRFAEARAPLAKAVARWGDLFPLNALYGAVLDKLGEAEPAYRALLHAHQLNPQDPATANLLYEVSLRLAASSLAGRQYATSLAYLAKATELRPDTPEPHRLLAQVYAATGRQAEAAAERHAVERLTPATQRSPR